MELLAINSDVFHQIVASVPKLAQRLQNLNSFQFEYVEGVQTEFFKSKTMRQVSEGHGLKKRLWHLLKKLNPVFYPDKKAYKFWSYMIDVHVAPISSAVILHAISKYEEPNITSAFTISMDVLFAIRMFVVSHTSYIDQETGLEVHNFATIIKQYFKTEFFFDFVAIFPIEIFGRFCTDKYYIRYMFINRLFRIGYMEMYYRDCKHKLALSNSLKWIHLIYWMIFSLKFMNGAW